MKWFWISVSLIWGIFIALLILAIHVQDNTANRFNQWTALCREDNGTVTVWSTSGSGVIDYECLRNGQIIDHEN